MDQNRHRLHPETLELGDAVMQGTRKTIGEWAEHLYGEDNPNTRQCIYQKRHSLLKHGFPIAVVDGMLVNVDSHVGYARTVAGRNSRMVSAYGRSFSLYASHMMRRFPTERSLINEMIQENIEMLAAIKKVS